MSAAGALIAAVSIDGVPVIGVSVAGASVAASDDGVSVAGVSVRHFHFVERARYGQTRPGGEFQGADDSNFLADART